MYLRQIVTILFESIEDEKALRNFKMHSARLALLLYIKLVKKQTRCGGLKKQLEQRMRHCYQFVAFFAAPQIQERKH